MRESEKNKWLQFNSKTNKKSIVKQQSIFQSPLTGRVGVGTLGPSTAKAEEASVLKRNIQTNQTKYFIKNTSGSKKAL